MAELIFYFSRTGENFFGGSMKYIDKGNILWAVETGVII